MPGGFPGAREDDAALSLRESHTEGVREPIRALFGALSALRRNLWLVPAAALPALAYSLTLAPTLTWAHGGADGGELLAAAATGGVPHPPGFPTYLALAALALRLPWGDAATRLNILSAGSAVAAAGMVAWAVGRNPGGKSRLAAWVAAWLFALAPLVWGQAVITEVYTTAAAFAGALLLLSRAGASAPKDFALGTLWGLGLGAHPVLLFFAPLLGTQRRRWGALLAGGALGLLPYAVLPLRAAMGAPVNWGNAQHWSGWWWLVSGGPYRGYLEVPCGETLLRLLARLMLLARQWTPLGLPLALYGWLLLRARQRGQALGEALAVLGTLLVSALWGSGDAFCYLIPALVPLAAWAGEGIAGALRRLADQRKPRALRLLPLLLPALLIGLGWRAADLHDDRAARDFAARVLAQAPERAILMTETDRHTFALWGYCYGLGASRTDVTVVDLDLLVFPWYRERLEKEPGLAGLSAAPDPWAFLRTVGRPLCTVGDGPLSCEDNGMPQAGLYRLPEAGRNAAMPNGTEGGSLAKAPLLDGGYHR